MIKYFTIEDLLKHYLQKKFHILKKALSVNLLLLFVLSQGVYLGIRCYLKNRLGTKQYW